MMCCVKLSYFLLERLLASRIRRGFKKYQAPSPAASQKLTSPPVSYGLLHVAMITCAALQGQRH